MLSYCRIGAKDSGSGCLFPGRSTVTSPNCWEIELCWCRIWRINPSTRTDRWRNNLCGNRGLMLVAIARSASHFSALHEAINLTTPHDLVVEIAGNPIAEPK